MNLNGRAWIRASFRTSIFVKQEMCIRDSGYATELTLDMPFSMTVEGETITVQMTMELIYHNPGQPVTMSFPDFSSYVEAA